MRSHHRHLFVLLAWMLLRGIASGASEEIQVYLDDHNKPHEFGLETHTNYVSTGRSLPQYAGEQPPFHVLRFTPELSLGLDDRFEAGLYLLGTLSPDGVANFDGAKLRMKYIAPRPREQTWWCGWNFELGRESLRVSEQPWTSELKGILGSKRGPWTLGANTNFDWDFSGAPSLELDTKCAREVSRHWQVGVEGYLELGPLNDLGLSSDRSHVLYACADWQNGRADATIAIGRGLTDGSDGWVMSVRMGTTFGP